MRLKFQSIKLTLLLSITAVLITSFFLGGWLSLHVLTIKRYHAYEQHRQELTARVAETLADPITHFSPKSGRLVIEAIKQDPNVVSVHVYDTTYEMDFVRLHFPSRTTEQMFENSADIAKDGQARGYLQIVFNNRGLVKDIEVKKQLIIIVFSVVFFATTLSLYFLLSCILFKPLNRVYRQAQQLSSNKLDEPVLWTRHDEISQVGQTLEGARHSIQNLVWELKERGAAYRHLSETDPLTGLANRLKINTILHNKLELRQHVYNPFGIILIDIDHFKRVNDTYGHSVGDQVLVEFAGIFRANTRDADVIGRWGGEEFIIISLENSSDKLYRLAEKIRCHVEVAYFTNVGYKTISLGVALHHENENIAQLVERADTALYAAKDKGRNTSVLAPEPDIKSQ